MSEGNDLKRLVGYRIRLKNRRVEVTTNPEHPGKIAIHWKKLDGREVKRACVILNQEGAEATIACLMEAMKHSPSAGILHLQGQPPKE